MRPNGDCPGMPSPVNRSHRVPPCRLCTRLGLLGQAVPAAVRQGGHWVCTEQRLPDHSCGVQLPLHSPGADVAPGLSFNTA